MKLSDGEWKVMQVVWEQQEVAARDVFDALEEETEWAYTTVKTMLTRLAEKGALAMHKRGNVSVFKPTISRAEARRSDLRGLVERAFDGAFGPMLQFLIEDKSLSAKERRKLQGLLEELEKENKGKRKGK